MRSRRDQRRYQKYRTALSAAVCDFCDIREGHNQFIAETTSFKIIRNIFPYDFWDGQWVDDHLMVVPKQHTDTLKSLNPKQAVEYLKLISDYEGRGYNVYARAPGSLAKTIVHQHTHLIKGREHYRKFVLHVDRPYFTFVR